MGLLLSVIHVKELPTTLFVSSSLLVNDCVVHRKKTKYWVSQIIQSDARYASHCCDKWPMQLHREVCEFMRACVVDT